MKSKTNMQYHYVTHYGSFKFGRFTLCIGTTSSKAAPPANVSEAASRPDKRQDNRMSMQFIIADQCTIGWSNSLGWMRMDENN